MKGFDLRCAIMQPTYLPWIGFFDLMDQVDIFILLDDVEFSKRSWQQRNRIKTHQGLQWLTVPVFQKTAQMINNVEISERSFSEKHAKAISRNYTRASYFKAGFPGLEEVLNTSAQSGRLIEVNCQLIRHLCKWFNINTPTRLASELGGKGSRGGRLAALCEGIQAKTYISPLGSAVYLLEELQDFNDRGIDVLFHHFEHPMYEQLFPPFVPQASAVDLLLNMGTRSLDIIRSGRKPVWTVSEMKKLW